MDIFYGIKNGIEQWKIYIPLRTKFRWINNADKETTQGYAQLPETGKYLVITKSLKDVALLYTFGMPAVAPSSETSFIKKELLEELKNRFQTIIVFFDNDRTGKAYMAKLRHKYPEFKYLIIPRQLKAKDISDFYKLYGRKLTKDLIKKGLKNYFKMNKELEKRLFETPSTEIEMLTATAYNKVMREVVVNEDSDERKLCAMAGSQIYRIKDNIPAIEYPNVDRANKDEDEPAPQAEPPSNN